MGTANGIKVEEAEKEREEFGLFGNIIFFLFRECLKFFIKLALNPRKDRAGSLDAKEVEAVYKREARSYDWKHHLTTRGQDLVWRRQAGFFVLNYVLQANAKDIKILDLCTGTGLTIKEICRILDIWKIGNQDIIGLDYTNEMLLEARKKQFKNHKVRFVRGDATSLTKAKEGFESFRENSFDLITQMFGIGGVEIQLDNLSEVLKALKPGGQYFMIDMHRPIRQLAGEWFFMGKWWQMPVFERRVYDEVTKPLVLKTTWAWGRETTPLFYQIKFITYRDEVTGKYFGFKILNFEYQSQRWWLSLAIMPVARIIVEKVEISEKEARRREIILNR